jgi:hypothetical protein
MSSSDTMMLSENKLSDNMILSDNTSSFLPWKLHTPILLCNMFQDL